MKTEAIKPQLIQVGLVTAGFVGANLVTSVAPVKNDKIKAIIPLALGLAATLASKNSMVQTIGAGAASYGAIKTLRTLLMGSDPTGANGIEGISDNPSVRKILDMLLPNLGSLEENAMVFQDGPDDYFEPAIIDVPFEEIDEVDEFEQMNGIENVESEFEEGALLGNFEEDSLLGYEYENELYI